jgi:hypothetical protein
LPAYSARRARPLGRRLLQCKFFLKEVRQIMLATLDCGAQRLEFSVGVGFADAMTRFSIARGIEIRANRRGTRLLTAALVRVITSATLREAIRAKLRAGASREMISFLISARAPSGLRASRMHGRAPRLPVEQIPHRGRSEFLAALSSLPGKRKRPAPKRSLASWLTSGMERIPK